MPHALRSLPAGVRIFVLDAGSQDATRAIAKAAGAVVVERAWTNFIDARRFAASSVTTPWTMMLDADERLDESLKTAIGAAKPADDVDAYRLQRVTYFCARPMRALGWDEKLVRIFRTGRAELRAHPVAGGSAALHERWEVSGRIEDLPGVLIHDSYPDRQSYRRKFERYTTLEAEGIEPSAGALVRSAAFAIPRFLWLLGPRGGLLAGWRGAYLAFWSALYPVVVRRKALLRRGRSE